MAQCRMRRPPGMRPSTQAANMAAVHADETDDSHPRSGTHPGASTVPAALAMAQRSGASGNALLRAVALGYDLCVRMALALGPGHTIATVLCDGGQRYASKLFDPAFLRERGLPTPPWL